MKIYADTPVRRTRQLVSDAWMLVWVVVWVKIGVEVDDAVMRLAVPGRKLAAAGAGLEDGLQDAGDRVAGVPLVPDGVSAPFDRASGAGAQRFIDAAPDLDLFALRALARQPMPA
ncbi:MAG: hypothetical protein JWR55_2767 [Aeromicrobium sp.]|jgi:hypothetical protein|nr:hypothetical protein [Aeromicrobium sp.]